MKTVLACSVLVLVLGSIGIRSEDGNSSIPDEPVDTYEPVICDKINDTAAATSILECMLTQMADAVTRRWRAYQEKVGSEMLISNLCNGTLWPDVLLDNFTVSFRRRFLTVAGISIEPTSKVLNFPL